MITLADLHLAAANVTARYAQKAEAKRVEEAEGIAWALTNKTSYSDSAWKERHQATVRQRAAAGITVALA
jgi:hypothetical protein